VNTLTEGCFFHEPYPEDMAEFLQKFWVIDLTPIVANSQVNLDFKGVVEVCRNRGKIDHPELFF